MSDTEQGLLSDRTMPPRIRKMFEDAYIKAGAWPALMAQCSHADLRPVRVRGERRERRMAG